MRNLLNNGWVELAARWILGLTFIYASYDKILAPADFAKIIYGYGLFPNAAINLIAIIIPFVELIAGLALIFGIYPRSAAFIINILLVAFVIVLSVNLIRGHEFDCGCFSVQASGRETSPQQMLLRDFILLVIGMQILLFSGARKVCLGPSGQR